MQTILIVDDEPSIRRALRGLFERGGYGVAEAGSADEAMAALGDGTPVDAVVCDVLMPGTGGIDLFDQLVERVPALRDRVVFLTGAAQHPAVQGPIEQRGVPLISKMDDLRLAVDAVRLALLRRR